MKIGIIIMIKNFLMQTIANKLKKTIKTLKMFCIKLMIKEFKILMNSLKSLNKNIKILDFKKLFIVLLLIRLNRCRQYTILNKKILTIIFEIKKIFKKCKIFFKRLNSYIQVTNYFKMNMFPKIR